MKHFQTLLDRYGPDFDQWPREAARKARRLMLTSKDARAAYDRSTELEFRIASSRPSVSEESVRRVINRSMLSIAQTARRLPLIDRFRILMAAPIPRVAFVMGLTAIGFGLGIALGAPEVGATDGPVLTASADDALF
jgi:hypothetical protein